MTRQSREQIGSARNHSVLQKSLHFMPIRSNNGTAAFLCAAQDALIWTMQLVWNQFLTSTRGQAIIVAFLVITLTKDRLKSNA